jgi:hypothetical protein
MRDITDGGDERVEQPSLRRRLAWFFGIAAVSGLAVAAAAELLRWLLLH